MRDSKPALDDVCQRALAYLAETDPAPTKPADAVIGFGVFDLSLPRFCGDLYTQGLAQRIIFTGGLGAGTGILGGPEAVVWRTELRRSHPEIADEYIVVERDSTNTAENIAFTTQLLAREHPELTFGRGIRTAIIVASPSRLRRVWLTIRLQIPELQTIRLLPPDKSLKGEQTLYAQNGIDYVSHLAGELDRITTYPRRGWIADEPLPGEMVSAWAQLRTVL